MGTYYIERNGTGIGSEIAVEKGGTGIAAIERNGTGVTFIERNGTGVSKIERNGTGIQFAVLFSCILLLASCFTSVMASDGASLSLNKNQATFTFHHGSELYVSTGEIKGGYMNAPLVMLPINQLTGTFSTHSYGSGTGNSTESYGSGTGSSTDSYGSGTGSSTDSYGSGTGNSTDSYGSGTGSSTDSYGSGTGSSTDSYGSGTGSSTDSYGSGTGSSTDSYGSGTGEKSYGSGTGNRADALVKGFVEVALNGTTASVLIYEFNQRGEALEAYALEIPVSMN